MMKAMLMALAGASLLCGSTKGQTVPPLMVTVRSPENYVNVGDEVKVICTANEGVEIKLSHHITWTHEITTDQFLDNPAVANLLSSDGLLESPAVSAEKYNIEFNSTENETTSTLTFVSVKASDAGNYICRAESIYADPSPSAKVHIEVRTDADARAMASRFDTAGRDFEPASNQDDAYNERFGTLLRIVLIAADKKPTLSRDDGMFIRPLGSTFNIYCKCEGIIEWRRLNGKHLTNSSVMETANEGTMWSRLRLHGLTYGDSGIYVCEAEGGLHASFELMVLDPLEFSNTTQNRTSTNNSKGHFFTGVTDDGFYDFIGYSTIRYDSNSTDDGFNNSSDSSVDDYNADPFDSNNADTKSPRTAMTTLTAVFFALSFYKAA